MYLQLPISLPKITNFHLSTIILMFDKQKKNLLSFIINFFSEVNNLVYNSMLSLYSMVKQLLCMQFSNGEGIEKLFSQYWPKCCLENISSHMVEHWTFTYFFFFFHIIVKRQTHNQVHINFSIHTFMAYRICTTF